MKNTDIIELKLTRHQVLDIMRAVVSVEVDFMDEIRNPETTEERREICRRSEKFWEGLRQEIRKQFDEQDKEKE